MERSFVVIGMPRGGTTYLYHNLQNHPEIFVPFRKEVNYFGANYGKGPEWYSGLYKDSKSGQVLADISPPCFMDPESDKRIKNFNHNTKVILVVRDPVEWALSFYSQFASFNYNMVPFSEFLNGYSYNVGQKAITVRFLENYIVNRISEIIDNFKGNIFVYHYKVLEDNPVELFNKLENFLGIGPFFNEETVVTKKINASGRRNFIWFSRLVSREGVINFLGKVFPRKLTMAVRKQFDSLSSKNSVQSRYVHSERDYQLAKERLKDQKVWVDKLFQESNYIIPVDGWREQLK